MGVQEKEQTQTRSWERKKKRAKHELAEGGNWMKTRKGPIMMARHNKGPIQNANVGKGNKKKRFRIKRNSWGKEQRLKEQALSGDLNSNWADNGQRGQGRTKRTPDRTVRGEKKSGRTKQQECEIEEADIKTQACRQGNE